MRCDASKSGKHTPHARIPKSLSVVDTLQALPAGSFKQAVLATEFMYLVLQLKIYNQYCVHKNIRPHAKAYNAVSLCLAASMISQQMSGKQCYCVVSSLCYVQSHLHPRASPHPYPLSPQRQNLASPQGRSVLLPAAPLSWVRGESLPPLTE